jgi:hypothetical protein
MNLPSVRYLLLCTVILITQVAPLSVLQGRVPVRAPRVGCGGGVAPRAVPFKPPPLKPPVPFKPPGIEPPPKLPILRQAPGIEPPVIKPAPGIEPPPLRPQPGKVLPDIPKGEPVPSGVGPGARPSAPKLPGVEPPPAGAAARQPVEQIRAGAADHDWARVDKLAGEELGRPGATAEVTDQLKAVQSQARELKAIEGLTASLAADPEKVSAKQLDELLDGIEDKELAAQVKEYFRARNLCKDDPKEALRLFRDLKKRIEVKSPAGGDAAGGPTAKVGPVPQPDAVGLRPPVQDQALAGLGSPDGDLYVAGRQCRDLLGARLGGRGSAYQRVLLAHLARLGLHAGHGQAARDDDADQAEAEVARLLGRELEPSERVLVRVMREKGKTAKEMAEILRGVASTKAKP